MSRWTTSFHSWSLSHRKTPAIVQATSTTTVPWMTWFWVGHSTFFSSAHDSKMKFRAASTSPAGRVSADRPAEIRLACHG